MTDIPSPAWSLRTKATRLYGLRRKSWARDLNEAADEIDRLSKALKERSKELVAAICKELPCKYGDHERTRVLRIIEAIASARHRTEKDATS